MRVIVAEVPSRYTFDIICDRVGLGNVVVGSALVVVNGPCVISAPQKRSLAGGSQSTQRVGHVVPQQRPGLVEQLRTPRFAVY